MGKKKHTKRKRHIPKTARFEVFYHAFFLTAAWNMCQIYQHPAEELLENVSIAVQEVSFMKLYQELRYFF